MRWTTFSGLTLPVGEPSTPIGGPPTHAPMVKLPGGRFFSPYELGADAPQMLPYRLTYRGVIYGDIADELQTALDALKAMRGVSGPLTREVYAELGGETPLTQWCWARLIQVQGTRESKHGYWLPVQLEFEISSLWRGEFREETYTLSETANTLVAFNVGNSDVTEVELTFAAHADITQLDVASNGEVAWRYTGTITAGKELVIDSGLMSVKNDGIDDYAHFELLATHTVDEWMLLHPPEEYLTVTVAGGDGADTLTLTYYDAWQ